MECGDDLLRSGEWGCGMWFGRGRWAGKEDADVDARNM